ncbi:cup-4 [Pristionchus pacificus]|uniref:Acetylcholine receptor-like protein cup-4 n=1 Tax=Pristionchus pacificus TaxID=54126 RepID=A0A454XPC4_PRIPA|nr:cup-4 [Pristionchus pacificus]|eukprot:PDM84063.1 cup-4 [Pristionchus pacificus]
MKRLLFLLGLLLVVSPPVWCQDEGEGIPNPDDDDEVQYNTTYAEDQTKLQMAIFRNYNRNNRPVVKDDDSTEVELHLHVTHVSFNQREQTMTVHGHMYMTWLDETLFWDPKDYGGVTTTNVKKWQIWMPELRVTNSVNGIYSMHEISRNAHITVQTLTTDGKTYTKSRVETYPTFSMKVGCLMDFSDYPYDVHYCGVRLYTPKKINQVKLRVYKGMAPTMFLSWSNESQKLTSGDFTINRASNNISWYRYGVTDDLEPLTGKDGAKTWSIYNMYIFYARHSASYFVTIALPLFSATVISIMSFLIKELQFATIINGTTFILHILFIGEFMKICPVSVFDVPRALLFHGYSMGLTMFAFAFHAFLCIACGSRSIQNYMIDGYSKAWSVIPFNPFPGFMDGFVKGLGDIRGRGWHRNMFIWRVETFFILSVLYLILFTRAFLI